MNVRNAFDLFSISSVLCADVVLNEVKRSVLDVQALDSALSSKFNRSGVIVPPAPRFSAGGLVLLNTHHGLDLVFPRD